MNRSSLRRFVVVLAALGSLLASAARAQTVPESALPIRISPDDKALRRGEVVTFVVEVVNTSEVDLLRDGPGAGVALQMRLPEGFSWVDGSGRIELGSGSGQVVRVLDPSAAREEPRLLQDRDGVGQTLNLGAGQGLRFAYQLAVAAPARPYTSGAHVVWLVDAGGTRLSKEVAAQLKIEPDPEMDLASMLGTVYCDADGDGRRDEGEAGLGGVRLVSDTGRVVDTDRDGRWHIRDLRPGAHVVKLDENSLPPGSRVTTDLRALRDLTSGVLARADFGVKCKVQTTGPTELEDPQGGRVEDAEAPPFHTVRGQAQTLAVAIDGASWPARRATLAIETGRLKEGRPERVRTTNVSWRPGALERPLTFRLDVAGELPDKRLASWRLDVAEILPRDARALVRSFSGRGLPPTSVTWDGMDGDNESGALRRGAYYEARLIVADGLGDVVESAPVWIGSSFGADLSEDARVVVREGLFDQAEAPTAKLQRQLQRGVAKMRQIPGSRLLVEVHVAATAVPAADLIKTRRGAFNIAEQIKKWGVAADRVLAVGYGGTRPLRPNVGDRNQAFNRRVEIVVLPPEGTLDPLPDIPEGPARVVVQGEVVKADPPDFAFVAPVARAPVIAIHIEAPDGARRSVSHGAVAPPSEVGAVDAGGALIVPPTSETGTTPPRVAEPPPLSEALLTDPLRGFGGAPLHDALGRGAIVDRSGGPRVAPEPTASQLEVTLPERGATLESPRVFVRGRTHRENTLTIQGAPIRLDADGAFAELIAVPSDLKELVIESRDRTGHVARVRWPLTVSSSELFLLALVDGVGGQLGARLEELDGYEKTNDGELFIAGRGALYAKARISGTALAKDIFVTAHVDSQRKHDFEPFFEQIVDPTRDYVIYGDASDDVRDVNTRGPFYLLVEADRSSLRYGNFRTDIEGLHLLRYDRSLFGGKLDVDVEAAKGWKTRAKGFVSDENRRLVRRHDELRATGGTLYYTSAKEIIEGSDEVSIVVRELDTGIELGRATLPRDTGYRIDYPSGRIMLSSPLSAVADAFLQIDGFQPFTGRSTLDGHAVFLEVDYEARAVRSAGDIAYGVHATQEIAGRVEIGGGVVREGRPAGTGGSDEDYLAYGVQAKVKLTDKSSVWAEWAETKDRDGTTQLSTDGGLKYRALSRAPDDQAGQALSLGFVLDVGELASVEDVDLVARAHWQLVEAGFSTVGTAREEATEKWGGDVVWKPGADNRVQLRYDGGTTLVPDAGFIDGLRAVARNRFLGRYDHRLGDFDLFGEAVFGQHRDDDDGVSHDTGGVALGARWRLAPRIALLLSQEALIGGDEAIVGDATTDRLTTNLGFEVAIAEDVAIRVLESVRWNGDNATRIGVVTRIDERSRLYAEQRVGRDPTSDRLASALVVGGDTTLGADGQGRAYGEYRLDGGIGGRTNQAVVGLGRSFEVTPGVRATFGYERAQIFDTPEAEPSGVPAGGSRDVLSGGIEALAADVVKFGGLYELRYDSDRPGEAATSLFQAVARNALDVKLGDDVTLLGVFNYALSQDLDTRVVVREDLEATFGLAVRPLDDDDLVLITRFSRVSERSATESVSLLGEALRVDDRRASNIFSVSAVIELPLSLRLTEKVAWRFGESDALLVPDGSDDQLLWVNRLAWEIVHALEVAGEFRMSVGLADLQIEENGGLVELSYTLANAARLGVGWSIDGFAGGLLPGEESNNVDNGFFVRLTGMY
ncbi:MAG: hypothetical protein IT385_15645 [Deltaproteobacteria bacterium]|nr:hypothetical protein [Deltaproteobacteria bacterium]